MDAMNAPGECWDSDTEVGPCHGETELTVSKSGVTRVYRCWSHAMAYYARMDALEARLQRDYPGYDVPGSPPPPWFDPTYAGERWNEDY